MWQHIDYDILLLVSFPDKLAKAAASTLYDTAAYILLADYLT